MPQISVDLQPCEFMAVDFFSQLARTRPLFNNLMEPVPDGDPSGYPGFVNYYRNGVGGDSKFAPICNEDFSSFEIAGTNNTETNALFARQASCDENLLYVAGEDGIIWRVNLDLGTRITAVNAPTDINYWIDVDVSRCQNFGDAGVFRYGWAIANIAPGPQYVMRWERLDETGADALAIFQSGDGHEFNHISVDETGSIWIAGLHLTAGPSGDDLRILSHIDTEGNELTSTVIFDNDPNFDSYWIGLCTFGENALGLSANSDGETYSWWVVEPNGLVTDTTSNVTIEGQPFNDWLDANNEPDTQRIELYNGILSVKLHPTPGTASRAYWGVVTIVEDEEVSSPRFWSVGWQ